MGAHNHGSVGTLDLGARSNQEWGLGPVPLGARWGQSNNGVYPEHHPTKLQQVEDVKDVAAG
jgi:hypothetical protein